MSKKTLINIFTVVLLIVVLGGVFFIVHSTHSSKKKKSLMKIKNIKVQVQLLLQEG
jgi:flagellar basal body-associated protein FliL